MEALKTKRAGIRRAGWHINEMFRLSFAEELTILSFPLIVWFALGTLNVILKIAVPFAPIILFLDDGSIRSKLNALRIQPASLL